MNGKDIFSSWNAVLPASTFVKHISFFFFFLALQYSFVFWKTSMVVFIYYYLYKSFLTAWLNIGKYPASILYKSIAGRYRPVRVADGPITARYRFIKNAYWVVRYLLSYHHSKEDDSYVVKVTHNSLITQTLRYYPIKRQANLQQTTYYFDITFTRK